MSSERRKTDARIDEIVVKQEHLHDCFETFKRESMAYSAEVKADLVQMKEVTEQIRDILASFKMVGVFAKWLAGLAAAGAAFVTLWQKVKGG